MGYMVVYMVHTYMVYMAYMVHMVAHMGVYMVGTQSGIHGGYTWWVHGWVYMNVGIQVGVLECTGLCVGEISREMKVP